MRSQTIEPCAMSLDLPPLVRSGAFFPFSVCWGDLSSSFCGGFRPSSKVGNSQLHSIGFYYLRSYGRGIDGGAG